MEKNASAVIRIIRFTASHLRLVRTVRQPRARDEKAILQGISSGSNCFLIFFSSLSLSYILVCFTPVSVSLFFSPCVAWKGQPALSLSLCVCFYRFHERFTVSPVTKFRVVARFRIRGIFDSRGFQRTIVPLFRDTVRTIRLGFSCSRVRKISNECFFFVFFASVELAGQFQSDQS